MAQEFRRSRTKGRFAKELKWKNLVPQFLAGFLDPKECAMILRNVKVNNLLHAQEDNAEPRSK